MTDDLPVVNVWHRGTTEWELAGRISGYESLTCETAFLKAGTWSMTAPVAAAGLDKLTAPAVVTVDWEGRRWATGLRNGRKTLTDANGNIRVEADGATGLGFFQDIVCYPSPVPGSSGGLDIQPEFGIYNAVAEAVVRALIVDHYRDRYGADIVVPASQGRGGTIKIKTRMSDLLQHVTKAARRGGIGVDVGLVNVTGSTTRAELTLSLWLPEDRSTSAILSHRIGSLRGWSYTETRPTMTKAIVGGGGEGAFRVWRTVTTPASETAAARFGGHVEGFVDASDTADPTELDQRGAEALDEALATDTFDLEASTAPGLRIWEKATLGDSVRVELADDIATTQPLGGLRLTATVSEGVKVAPIVGDPETKTSERRMARLVRDARRQIRQLQVTRERT